MEYIVEIFKVPLAQFFGVVFGGGLMLIILHRAGIDVLAFFSRVITGKNGNKNGAAQEAAKLVIENHLHELLPKIATLTELLRTQDTTLRDIRENLTRNFQEMYNKFDKIVELLNRK